MELEAALIRVAGIVNSRPLTARMYSDDEFYPVCPADLLLGRMTGFTSRGEERDVAWSERLERIEEFVGLWWKRWEQAAFLLFTPRRKWTQEVRGLEVGDIVMLCSAKKLGQTPSGLPWWWNCTLTRTPW